MKKGLIYLSLTLLATGGTVGGIIAASGETFAANNATAIVKKEAKLNTINEGGATPGNAFYVKLEYVKNWWFGNNAETWVCFYNTSEAGSKAWVQVNVSKGLPNDSDIYEIRVPEMLGGMSSTAWNKAIVCRSSSGAADETWSNIWNQTGNMDVSSGASDYKNAVEVLDGNFNDENDNNKQKKQANSFAYSASTRISKWALGYTGDPASWTNYGLCVSNGSTDADALAASWNASATAYAAIPGDDVKAYFSNLEGVEGDANSTAAANIAARYDHIRAGHPSFADFANRA